MGRRAGRLATAARSVIHSGSTGAHARRLTSVPTTGPQTLTQWLPPADGAETVLVLTGSVRRLDRGRSEWAACTRKPHFSDVGLSRTQRCCSVHLPGFLTWRSRNAQYERNNFS